MLFTRGFTAIELLVTIAIVTVLAALALPNFSYLVDRWRVMQAADLLKSTLYYARSEAIRRGIRVVLEQRSCTTGTGWNCGWRGLH